LSMPSTPPNTCKRSQINSIDGLRQRIRKPL